MRGGMFGSFLFHGVVSVSVVTCAVIVTSSGEPEVGQRKSDKAINAEMIVNLLPLEIESQLRGPRCRAERKVVAISPIADHLCDRPASARPRVRKGLA